jgi:maleylpyruvate isomerase
MDVSELDRTVAGCAASHQRLLEHLDGLTDAQARAPSLLPEWSVGHVLTHLARNAEGFLRMLAGASRGEVAEMYPAGLDGRQADIEAGAGRDAAALVADVRDTIYRLEGQWAGMSAEAWAGEGVGVFGPVPIADIPFRRWREVEVHHADLGLGYGPAQWPPEYVRLELQRLGMLWASRKPMGMTSLPEAALAAAPHERVAWMLGRQEIDGLGPAGIYG